MSSVYVIVENGSVYPSAYTTYSAARAAVIEKHRDVEDLETDDIHDLPKTETGDQTDLYIEKGINIIISKLPVVSSGGKRRANTRRRQRRYTR
jgi:hypothetical protein